MPFHVYKRKIQDAMFGNTQNTAGGVQADELANARLGIVYSLAHTDMNRVRSFSASPFNTLVVNTTAAKDFIAGQKAAYSMGIDAAGQLIDKSPLKDMKDSAMAYLKESEALAKVKGAANVVIDGVSELKAKLKQLISDFFYMMLEAVKKRYGVNMQMMEILTDFVIWGTNTFATGLSAAIPGWGYVKTAAGMYADAKKAFLKSKMLIEQCYSGYGVELLGGHPSIIANALARHSVAGIASAAKGLAISSTSLGLSIAADVSGAGGSAGMIFSVVTSIFNKIFNLVESLVQKFKVTSVLEDAKQMWRNRSNSSSKLKDHKRFSEWFQHSVIATPVIASLTMNSGFAAHPYRFLQLLEPSGNDAMKADFAKGAKHIETLKKQAGQHIREFSGGYSVTFSSDEAIVEARLKEALSGKAQLDGHEYFMVGVDEWDSLPAQYDRKPADSDPDPVRIQQWNSLPDQYATRVITVV
ncbi:hypothetical protein [Aliamphritea hakodatensis]|uniref:hypothetical protein n=1 Tax=Aliamphritea hakodatensis TaxID=2895352 RepID=UPI0022FD9B30|nr:hypothetical protein [Aliamphritea hakodatensis]